MKIAVQAFRGEVPRLTPRELPENAAQAAVNCRLLTGDLEAWRHFLLERTLVHGAPVRTIYRLGTNWLSWTQEVEVARGPIPGDATRRIYITGLDVPRWSNLALATTGAEPFPVATRPIGVPSPTVAPVAVPGTVPVASVSVSDPGNVLSGQWTVSPISTAPTVRNVTQSAGTGNPAPSYRLEYSNNVGLPCFAYRNFGISDSRSVTMAVDVAMIAGVVPFVDCGVKVKCTEAGAGVRVGIGSFDGTNIVFFVGPSGGWGDLEVALAQSSALTLDATGATWYRVEVSLAYVSPSLTTVRAQLRDGSTVLADLTASGAFESGDFCGFDGRSNQGHQTFYDNILVTGTGSLTATPETAVSYVFTYVNDLGEQSAPSPASTTVLRPDGVSVAVTTPTTDPGAPYVVTVKRLYRAVTGVSGTIFRFVAEIPLATAVYTDALDDEALGEALESEGWELPPSDLRGILALPNGVLAGFRRNQLCLSAQNRPHAWPVAFRLTTDTDIVGIGAIDSVIVIGTQAGPYLAMGTTPESYAMSRLEHPQALVAPRTLTYLTRIGVVYASPDGLVAISGAGQVEILTRSVFTREQWQALVPSSMWGIAHDDVYWLFYDTGSARGGFAIDMRPDGAGIVTLSWHAACGHVDPLTDTLYLVLSSYTDAAGLTDFVLPAGNPIRIYAFDAHPTLRMAYRWRGKLNLMPHPSAMHFAKVEAVDYAAVRMRVFGSSGAIHDRPAVSGRAFRVDGQRVHDEFVIELAGTSRVRTAQVSQTVTELD